MTDAEIKERARQLTERLRPSAYDINHWSKVEDMIAAAMTETRAEARLEEAQYWRANAMDMDEAEADERIVELKAAVKEPHHG